MRVPPRCPFDRLCRKLFLALYLDSLSSVSLFWRSLIIVALVVVVVHFVAQKADP